MTGRRLVLWRHGRTAWNATGRAQGHADVPLDEVGVAQAAESATLLAKLDPVALWSSDLARARETAEHLAVATGLPVRLDARLREYDVGARQGMTLAEFAERFPAQFRAWNAGEDAAPVPGAETMADVAARIVPAVREHLAELAPDETGVLVTHGASLKVALVGVLGWPPALAATIRGMDNGAWAELVEDLDAQRLRLAAYNVGAPGPGGDADFASPHPVG